MISRLRNRQRGFTLIELLIVVAIIGIIAAILIPELDRRPAEGEAEAHHGPGDVESTPLGMEAPMNTQMVQEICQETEIPPSKPVCVHQRLIEDVRTRSGTPTGDLRWLECGRVFDDPHRSLD